MWTTTSPIVIAGYRLSGQEAWQQEFEGELRQQCDGHVDKEWLVEISKALFRRSPHEEPRRMARLAYAILMFDAEEIEETDHAARSRAMRVSWPDKPT